MNRFRFAPPGAYRAALPPLLTPSAVAGSACPFHPNWVVVR